MKSDSGNESYLKVGEIHRGRINAKAILRQSPSRPRRPAAGFGADGLVDRGGVGFLTEGLFALAPDKRLARLRELADDARQFAENTSEDKRSIYLRIAERWESMAQELEADARPIRLYDTWRHR